MPGAAARGLQVSVYDADRAMVDEELAEVGFACTVLRPTSSGPAYNPVPGAPGQHPARALELERKIVEVQGSRVKRVELKLLLSVGDLTIIPTTSDKVRVGGEDYAITAALPFQPGGSGIYFEVVAVN